MTTMTQTELRAELVARFGDNPLDWAFVCPQCGDIANGHDFAELEVKEISAYLGLQCYGRAAGALKGPAAAWKGRGCDWCAFGLIGGPLTIELPTGKTMHGFNIAPAPLDRSLIERGAANDAVFDTDPKDDAFDDAINECRAIQEAAVVQLGDWKPGNDLPDRWTLRDWSRIYELATGFDSVDTVESQYRATHPNGDDTEGMFECVHPGCKFRRRDPELLWLHVHTSRKHRE